MPRYPTALFDGKEPSFYLGCIISDYNYNIKDIFSQSEPFEEKASVDFFRLLFAKNWREEILEEGAWLHKMDPAEGQKSLTEEEMYYIIQAAGIYFASQYYNSIESTLSKRGQVVPNSLTKKFTDAIECFFSKIKDIESNIGDYNLGDIAARRQRATSAQMSAQRYESIRGGVCLALWMGAVVLTKIAEAKLISEGDWLTVDLPHSRQRFHLWPQRLEDPRLNYIWQLDFISNPVIKNATLISLLLLVSFLIITLISTGLNSVIQRTWYRPIDPKILASFPERVSSLLPLLERVLPRETWTKIKRHLSKIDFPVLHARLSADV